MRRRTAISVAIGGACASMIVGADLPYNQTTLPVSQGGKMPTFFHNGVFPIVEVDYASLSLVGSNGSILFTGLAIVPGSKMTFIASVSASPTGALVLCGSAMSPEGKVVPVLLLGNTKGEMKSIVRTSPFFPVSVVFVGENTIAALGRVSDENFKSIPGHKVVRIYDANGKLKAEAVPEETILHNGAHPVQSMRLVSDNERIGLFDLSNGRWGELTQDGVVKRPILALLPLLPVGAKVTGVSLGRKLTTFSVQINDTSQCFDLDESGGKPALKWVAGLKMPPGVTGYRLVGSDVESMVLHTSDNQLIRVQR